MTRVSVLRRSDRSNRNARRSTMSTNRKSRGVSRILTLAVLLPVFAGTRQSARQVSNDQGEAKTLYVWAGDQARVAPDFLAVIDFDEDSPRYGKVVRTLPVPGLGGSGNE